MKKTILLIAALILMVTATFANDTLRTAPIATFTCNHDIMHDTVFVVPHPNAEDSVKVVKVVDGVLHVISQFAGEKPLLQVILDNQYTSGGVVALILAFWRRREIKKIKKKAAEQNGESL